MPPRKRTEQDETPAENAAATSTTSDPDAPRPLTDEGERVVRAPRDRQFPSLHGAPEVEIAERSQDVTEPASSVHVKDFVTTKRDYESGDKDGMHARNTLAVRQYLMSQGLRPDAKVEFEGEHEHDWDEKSIVLRYTVSVQPAATATDYDVAHALVTEDVTATERAEFDAKRVDRLRIGYDARREGTPEADRPLAGDGSKE